MIADDFRIPARQARQDRRLRREIRGECRCRLVGGGQRAPISIRAGAGAGTLETYALNDYGAVQLGTHRFYALRRGKPDLLTETSRFVDVWKLENGAWKLSRVISYGHELDPAAESAH